jgi:hypothetical protein
VSYGRRLRLTKATTRRVVDDGRRDRPNVVERAIRPIALNRENALSASSEDGPNGLRRLEDVRSAVGVRVVVKTPFAERRQGVEACFC